MTDFDWENRIKEWSRKRIEALDDEEKAELPPEVLESGSFACPGTSEEQIVAVEARLGVTFPSSYREFLKVSNGLRPKIYCGLYFYSVEEIDWYALDEQDWIDYLIESNKDFPVTDEDYFLYDEEQEEGILRPEYLQTALDISSRDEGVLYLLNPQVITIDGEWEAWSCDFSNAGFGISRYRSFYEMMNIIFNKLELLIWS